MTTKEIFEKIGKDIAFTGKFKEMKTQEEVYELCQGLGLTDSLEEFMRVTAEMKTALGTLSATEIDAIVGGGDTATPSPLVTPGDVPTAAQAASAV